MDSVTVKAIGSKRAKTEVFPLLMVCLDTGAAHTQVAYDYCTGPFLLQWDYFVAERGRPSEVVSDRGSQRTYSDNTDLISQIEGQEVERGTNWRFVPQGCQWRNELAKLQANAIRVMLKQMLSRH